MKKTSFMLLFTLLFSLAAAEHYTIATGINTQSNVPTDADEEYGWSKTIYTASELNSAGLPAGLIAGTAFHVGNTCSATPQYNQRVFIRNTTSNVYLYCDNALPDNTAFQKVYQASYIWNNMSWNEVYIDNSVEKSFLVTNNGYSALNVSSVVLDGNYFSSAEPFNPVALNIGESFTFTVQYTPITRGDHNGTITFNYDNSNIVIDLSAHCHDPVISSFPWCEDFGTVTADWPIQDWHQFYGPYPSLLHAYDAWVQDDWLNQSNLTNKAARIRVNTSNYNIWYVSPAINFARADYNVSFDLGLTNYDSTNSISAPQVSGSERFVFAMSTDSLMTSPLLLREWNNTGSEYRFNDIPHTGMNVDISLLDLQGTRYFAFYLECRGGATGNFDDLMVDNVTISTRVDNPGFESPAIDITELKGNRPNPFNPETTITYQIKEAGPVCIEIYNLKGQLVTSLVHENKAAGEYSVVWPGTDLQKRPVASGVYLYKMKSGVYSCTRKMIMMK